MKCFNHPQMDAVATCQKCGKGLCRDCAAKYTPCMCDSCAAMTRQRAQAEAQSKEEQRKQKYKDALVDTRSEFIGTSIIGIIIGIIGAWWTAKDGNSSGFGETLGFFFAWFCVPFGWKILTYLQSFFPVTIFGTAWFWIIYIFVKVMLSILVGIPAFIYQLVKTIINKGKINNL